MQRFNLTKDLFEFEERSSDESADSVIYISSDYEGEVSDSWDSDWSIDTEALIDKIGEGSEIQSYLDRRAHNDHGGVSGRGGSWTKWTRPNVAFYPQTRTRIFRQEFMLCAFKEAKKIQNRTSQYDTSNPRVAYASPRT